jgi:hypothetical protein
VGASSFLGMVLVEGVLKTPKKLHLKIRIISIPITEHLRVLKTTD